MLRINEIFFLTHRHLLPIFGAGVDPALPPWNPAEEDAAGKKKADKKNDAAAAVSSSPSCSSSLGFCRFFASFLAKIFIGDKSDDDDTNNDSNYSNNDSDNDAGYRCDSVWGCMSQTVFFVVVLFSIILFYFLC